jgi:membrane protease YdiL (CAAX protease family)
MKYNAIFYRIAVLTLLTLLFLRACYAFAPSPLPSTNSALSLRLRFHPLPRPRRVFPLHFRDRELEEEQFTKTVQTSHNAEMQQSAIAIPATSSLIVDQPKTTIGVSLSLIRAICFSQATMLFIATVAAVGILFLAGKPIDHSLLHWNGATSFDSFWDFPLTSTRVLYGVLATVPMVAVGSMVENSGRRDASHVNFSTTNMVVCLFGRRQSKRKDKQRLAATSTPTVLSLSFLIALFTGISEEFVFRGFLPTAVFYLSHSIIFSLLSQSVIFGLCHLHKNSTPIENKLVLCLQFVNGLWQGVVYLLTGGDLLPCIIAHMLYDMHVFVETWKQINDQMDWTALAIRQSLSESEEREIRLLQTDIGRENLSDDMLAFCRRFFHAFDYEHRGSLSLRDVQRAISYAFLRDEVVPTEEQVQQAFAMVSQHRTVNNTDAEQRLPLSDFLKLLFAFKEQAQSQAVPAVRLRPE